MNLKKIIAPKGWKRFFKAFAFWCALGATTPFLFFSIDKFRTKAKWESYRAELVANGVPITFKELAPPPVYDAEDFAKSHLFKGVFDKNGVDTNPFNKKLQVFKNLKKQPSLTTYQDGKRVNLEAWAREFNAPSVAEKLAEFRDEMAELTTLAAKPNARFDIPLDDNDYVLSGMSLGHLKMLRDISTLFCLRGLDSINCGQVEQAFSDAQAILRIARSIENEPFLITQLVVLSIRPLAYQIIWEGMLQRQWSDEQLAAFQNELTQVNALSGLRLGLQGERVYNITVFEVLLSHNSAPKNISEDFAASFNLMIQAPKTWVYSSLVHLNTWHDEWLANIDVNARRVRLERMTIPPRKGPAWLNMDRYLADIGTPALDKVAARSASHQTTTDQALLACALERYYLKNEAYPESLEALIPEFLNKIPHDVASGEPIRYSLTADGRFTLNAAVWERDDKTGTYEKSLTKEIVWKFE